MNDTPTTTSPTVIETDRGDRIAFDDRGHGRTVVFISGAGPHRAADPGTTETAVLAADGTRTLFYDRLGRGESTAAPGPITLDREIAAVRALITHAGGGPAILVGHSSGCAIALAAAGAGVPVAGLVLFESPTGQASGGTTAWANDFLAHLDADELERAQETYMRDMPPQWMAGAKASGQWEAIVAASPTLRPDAEALRWADDDAALGAIAAPTLAFIGEETFPGMSHSADELARLMPNAQARTVPGAEHQWVPADMAARLVAFAGELDS